MSMYVPYGKYEVLIFEEFNWTLQYNRKPKDCDETLPSQKLNDEECLARKTFMYVCVEIILFRHFFVSWLDI